MYVGVTRQVGVEGCFWITVEKEEEKGNICIENGERTVKAYQEIIGFLVVERLKGFLV